MDSLGYDKLTNLNRMNLDPFQNPARFNHDTVKWRVVSRALVTMAINPGVPGYDGKILMISLEG